MPPILFLFLIFIMAKLLGFSTAGAILATVIWLVPGGIACLAVLAALLFGPTPVLVVLGIFILFSK